MNPKTGTSCGELTGHIKQTESYISIGSIDIKLDFQTAYALCNVLSDNALVDARFLEKDQIGKLSSLGAAIGRIVGHGSAKNNGLE